MATGVATRLDTDDDGDSILDGVDSAPLDPTQCQDLDGDTCDDCSVVQPPDTANDGLDTDGDGVCDATDTDDDGDGYSDADETTNCSPPSDPQNAASTPTDTDGDGSCDTLDTDDDGDSYPRRCRQRDPLDPSVCATTWTATLVTIVPSSSRPTPPTTASIRMATASATRATPTPITTATSNADETTNCSPPSDPLNAASTPTDTDDDGSCDTLGYRMTTTTPSWMVRTVDAAGPDAVSGPGRRHLRRLLGGPASGRRRTTAWTRMEMVPATPATRMTTADGYSDADETTELRRRRRTR